MSKFNTSRAAAAAVGARRAAATSPVSTTDTRTLTHEGAPAFVRDAKSELFLLAVSNLVSEDTFYENAADRDARYRQLIHTVAVSDGRWLARFLPWLRTTANLRSAPMVGALEAVKARLTHPVDDGVRNRQLVASVLQRADEPGEAVAYWMSRYGRAIPKPVKRGIGEAARRLYTQRALLKYDTDSKAVRFADVLELCHVRPGSDMESLPLAKLETMTAEERREFHQKRTADQSALFAHALDRRHGRRSTDPARLWTITANRLLREQVADGRTHLLLDPTVLSAAGMTWEDALSLAGPGVDKAKLWTALTPSMGYMALLRNLRNLDQAGVGDDVAAQVCARIADPEQVARSRQLPFRFLSAHENAPSLRWGHALDVALGHSLANIPKLEGRSLVLIDTSASMSSAVSGRSTVTAAKAAAVFGMALAIKDPVGVDVYGFAEGVFRHVVGAGDSLLRQITLFTDRTGEVGHGTHIYEALERTYDKHDRVFLISDMQTMTGGRIGRAEHIGWGAGYTTVPALGGPVPEHVPIYGFNLGGYRPAAMATGTASRHEFGGLTDATFRMIGLLERGENADWPF